LNDRVRQQLSVIVPVVAEQPRIAGSSVRYEQFAQATPRLRRTLTLRHLLLYGIVFISPVAPLPIFGILSERGHGHVVTAILIAMIAMLFTSISYGRMARAYPSAGSAYTYVAREINPALGYITGWGIVMDYILNPVICTIWCAEQSHAFVPDVPVFAWKIFFVVAFTTLNVQAVRSSARIAAAMVAGMGMVIVIVFFAAGHYLLGHPHHDPAFFTRPFYDPQSFSYSRLLGCTSIAVLTYIGFDGISTLSEETKNPRRNILLATVLTCLLIGILSAAEVYVAQLVWPATQRFPDVDTAYVWVAGRIWRPLFTLVGLALLLGTFAAGMAAHLGAARLLYGMGRSKALPQRFFGIIDRKNQVPRNNVLFVGAAVIVGSFFLSYTISAEMLNYGALIAFMGVNAAAFLRYFVREPRKRLWNFIPPILGFCICLTLWWNLSPPAKVLGSVWMALGVAYGLWATRGFRTPLIFEAPEE
jgi:putrescine importer